MSTNITLEDLEMGFTVSDTEVTNGFRVFHPEYDKDMDGEMLSETGYIKDLNYTAFRELIERRNVAHND